MFHLPFFPKNLEAMAQFILGHFYNFTAFVPGNIHNTEIHGRILIVL